MNGWSIGGGYAREIMFLFAVLLYSIFAYVCTSCNNTVT